MKKIRKIKIEMIRNLPKGQENIATEDARLATLKDVNLLKNTIIVPNTSLAQNTK